MPRVWRREAFRDNTAGRVQPACRRRDGSILMRILVIEDDAEAASYLAKAFDEAGHSVDVASDGLEGYALAQEGLYQVLVVDRMLPSSTVFR